MLEMKQIALTMNTKRFLMCGTLFAVVAFLLSNHVAAQSGTRFLDPVFDEVTTTEAVPFSSAILEGQTSPTTLYLDFYEPTGDTMAKRPLVITVFGGAFVTGSRDYVDMVAYCTRLAKLGYATASIDYRLLSWLQFSESALMRDAYMAAQDVSSAIRFFKLHCDDYRIDPERIFLLGNSAGSIAILAEMFMGEEERPEQTFTEPDLGTMHSSGFEEYAGISPTVAGAIPHWGGVNALDVIDVEEYTPICMIHGTDDLTVPFDSGYCFSNFSLPSMPYMYGSQAIATHLESIGITDFEFHPFEGEEHAFYYNPTYQIDEEKFGWCFDITRDFLWKHLGWPTSTQETTMQEVTLYPNPATASIVFHGDALLPNGSYQLQVLDVLGREMTNVAVSSPHYSIDISSWPSGVYVVRFEQNCNCCFRKFVKR